MKARWIRPLTMEIRKRAAGTFRSMTSRLGDHALMDSLCPGHKFRIWFDLAVGEDQNRRRQFVNVQWPCESAPSSGASTGTKMKKSSAMLIA